MAPARGASPASLIEGLDTPIGDLPQADRPKLAGEALRARIELLKLQFEYAWRDWQFNAQQRLSVFNYFVLVAGATGSLLGLLVKEDSFVGAAAVGVIGALLSLVFAMLDRRNEELLRSAEDVLLALEEQAMFRGALFTPAQRHRRWPFGMRAETLPDGLELPLGLRMRSAEERRLRGKRLADAPVHQDGLRRQFREVTGIGLDGASPYRFGFWLPAVQWMVAVGFLLAAIACLLAGKA